MSLFENFNLIEMLLSIPGAVLVFTLRGWAKAFAADKLGDPTPRNMGKLTMNPLAHIDLIGFIFIVLLFCTISEYMLARLRIPTPPHKDNAALR